MQPKKALPADLFEELIDSIEELVFVIDTGLRILTANRAAAFALGYTMARLSSLYITSLVAPEDTEFLRALISSTLDKRGGSMTLVTKSGAGLAVRFIASPLGPRGEPEAFLLVARHDQPDSAREAAVALRSYERRILLEFGEPLLIVDAVSRVIRECNDAIVSLFGFSRDELLGRRPYELGEGQVGHQLERALEEKVQAIILAGGVFREVLELPRKGKPAIPCEILGLPFYRMDAGIDSVLLIVFDRSSVRFRITELRELIEKMNKIGSQLSDIVSSIPKETPAARLSDLGFSPRQVKIACMLAKGMSSKEIGYDLGISDSTVRNHLSMMFKKLGVSTRLGFMKVITERRLRIS